MRDALSSRILELANALADADPAKRKALRRQLENMAHHSARPGAPKKERETTAAALLEVVKGNQTYAPAARAYAAYLLGFIGGKNEERSLATYEKDTDIADAVQMARDRIRRA